MGRGSLGEEPNTSDGAGVNGPENLYSSICALTGEEESEESAPRENIVPPILEEEHGSSFALIKLSTEINFLPFRYTRW